MKEYKSGTYILHKGYKTFNPSFINDDIDWKLDELAPLLQDASLWLGKLNSYADLIPNFHGLHIRHFPNKHFQRQLFHSQI